MSALPHEPHQHRIGPVGISAEVVAIQGGWRFTRNPVVEPAQAQVFHRLYALAFNPLKTRSVARQVLTEEEFYQQMADQRIEKYVAWDTEGRPVGITTLTKHLDAIPWISPEYFAAHYPDQWERDAVWYLGFTLAHPTLRHQRFLETIIRVGIDALAQERAVLAYDVCAYNNETLRFTDRIVEMLSRYPMAELAAIDTQTYYRVTFA